MAEDKGSPFINSLNSLMDYIKSKDNAASNVYVSPIPDICKSEKCILGVDEAGAYILNFFKL